MLNKQQFKTIPGCPQKCPRYFPAMPNIFTDHKNMNENTIKGYDNLEIEREECEGMNWYYESEEV